MDEFETGVVQVDAPRPDQDAALAYVEVANAQEESDRNAQWKALLGSDKTETPAAPVPAEPSEPAAKEDEGGGVLGAIKSGFSDLGRGIVEGPSQIAGGIVDAFDEAGTLLGELTGAGGIQFYDENEDGTLGAFNPKFLNHDEFQEVGGDDLIEALSADAPESATGGFIRATSQFLTGFIPALKGVKAAGVTNGVGAAMGAGAIADMVVFDPHEERLSTFLNEIPALEPYVSDYLADNNPENESSWEGRLKNAIEGAGLGLAADGAAGLFKAFKYYKKMREVKSQLGPETSSFQAQVGKDAAREAARQELVQDIPDEALRPLGDPEGPAVVEFAGNDRKGIDEFLGRKPSEEIEPEALLRPDPDAPAPEPKVFINHARIQTGDDVKAVIQQMADADEAHIKGKTRGTVTNAQTITESSQEYRDLDDLIGRPPGPMTAAQAVAARRLLTSSGEQIVELAKRAAALEATPADIYNFRRGMAVHNAIQSEVIAARTETARALQSWAIPAGQSKMRSEAINDLIMREGGAGDLQALAKAVGTVGDNPAALNSMTRELGKGRFGKALYQVWINGILSSPKTHMVNILSNSMVAAYAIPERYLAAGVSKVFYNGEIAHGEASAQMFGAVKGIRDGLRLIWHGNNAAEVDGIGDVFDAFGKADFYGDDFSSAAFGLNSEGAVGRGFDMLGKAVNVPGSMLQVEDKLFKSIGYRMELNALAYRTARNEGLDGDAAAKRVSEILLDPPESLKVEAIDVAHYQTFTNPLGKIGKKFQGAVQAIPFAKVVLPFIRTPTNIIKYTFARTPLAYMSGAIRADISAGGARAAQAHARVALGSMVMVSMADMALEGTVTGRGPSDSKLRSAKMNTGWMPYSVKVGDRWFQYSRLDPIGMMMGIGADIAEISTNANNEETEMVATAAVLALANNLANKTYMTGLYDFIGAIDPSNPTNTPERYLQNFAGSMVPYSSFLRSVAGASDTEIRETRGTQYGTDGKIDPVGTFFDQTLDRMRSAIPGMGSDLPPRRDLYGEPIDRASQIGWGYDFLSPIASRVDNPDPVTQIILENDIKISNAPRIIEGVRLNAEQYSEFSRLAGQPLKERLDKVIKSRGFKRLSDGPDGMKAEIIRDLVNTYRDQARAQMLRDDPELRRLSFTRKKERASLLKGSNDG